MSASTNSEVAPSRYERRQERIRAIRRFETFFWRRLRKADTALREHEVSRALADLLQGLVAAGGSAPQRWLGESLELDPAHLCRLLKSLDLYGLVALETDPRDGRRREASLTAGGRLFARTIEGYDRDRVKKLLERLPDRQQGRLVEAMAVIEEVLTRAPLENFLEEAQER